MSLDLFAAHYSTFMFSRVRALNIIEYVAYYTKTSIREMSLIRCGIINDH